MIGWVINHPKVMVALVEELKKAQEEEKRHANFVRPEAWERASEPTPSLSLMLPYVVNQHGMY